MKEKNNETYILLNHRIKFSFVEFQNMLYGNVRILKQVLKEFFEMNNIKYKIVFYKKKILHVTREFVFHYFDETKCKIHEIISHLVCSEKYNIFTGLFCVSV